MKTLIQNIRVVAATAAIMAMPHLAHAARDFASVTPAPASTNVMAGFATNITITVNIANGSGASSDFKGTAQLSAISTNGTVTTSPTTQSSPNLFFTGTGQTWSPTVTISTTASTPTGTYTIQLIADTNAPPTPDNLVPLTNTFTLVVGTPAGFVPQTVWTPAGVNSNWSTAANWSAGTVPTPSNDVDFYDNSGAPTSAGITDSIVTANISVGSVMYGQTNTTHTTLINPGVTLTVGGDANGLVAGTGTDVGQGETTFSAITGAGGTLLATNPSANVFVGQSHNQGSGLEATAQATLDLSGLSNFRATVARLIVGADITIKGSSGILNLAQTNTIVATVGSTAPQIDISDNTQSQAVEAISSSLLLGETNGFYADSIAVGRGKTDGSIPASMSFNSIFANPTAYFRGTNGNNSSVGTWTIADGYNGKSSQSLGDCDFSLGTVNALVNTMYVGKGANPSLATGAVDKGNGTLTFAAGIVTVTNLNVGYGFSGGGSGTGTVNANGGVLSVISILELGLLAGDSGTLNISNGTVTANSGITAGAGTAIINMTAGSLSVTNGNATTGTAAAPLDSLAVSNSILTLAVQSFVPSVATENLIANGTTNIINVSAVPVLTGFPSQFPIIQYGYNGGSASGNTATFGLGSLPSSAIPYGAYISNNVANNSIDIVFTNGPSTPALTWDGRANGNWDLTTTNWIPKSGPDTAYANGDFVTFNDALGGTPNINLTTALMPGTVTANNSAENYVFSGSGSLGGSVTLVKYGSATLTLAETGGDNFSGGIIVTNGTLILDNAGSSISGGTSIGGGTLQIGNNDANGTLPGGSVLDNGTLAYGNANNVSMTNTITGGGTLTENDTNVLALTGNNGAFTGTAIAAQGTLQIGNSNSVFAAAAGITVSNGATLDSDGQALYNGSSALEITASGAGVGGNGAIVNNSTNATTLTFHVVNLNGDTTFGGVSSWDIRNSSGNTAPANAQLSGSGPYNLTKVGANTVTMRGVNIDGNLENINIMGGGLHFTATATASISSLGDPNGTNTVYTNATVTFDTIGNIPGKNFVLTNGGTIVCSSTNTFGDSLTLYGPGNTISVGSGSQFTITSAIIGSGSLSKNGSGPLFLGGTNTYAGSTTVSGGTLALYNSGSDGYISSSALINLTSGTILDVSGRSDGTFTLTSGQTLQGGNGGAAGSINGNFTASAGSIFAPATGTTNTGSIAVSTNAVLQGSAAMRLNAATGLSDQLLAYSITYGGTLTVTNALGTITNGQTFQLFVASNGVYNAGSFSSIALPTAIGLTWTTNLAVNGTITANVVNVPPTQPNITGFNLTGTQLIINGTSSLTDLNYTYTVLNGTNLLTPLTNWTILSTGNSFNPGGNFRITNTVNPNMPQSYYMIRVP